jgi:preprotein translocase subunit SecE
MAHGALRFLIVILIVTGVVSGVVIGADWLIAWLRRDKRPPE